MAGTVGASIQKQKGVVSCDWTVEGNEELLGSEFKR